MPRHKTGGSYQPGENHKGWKGGTEDYWHRKARELTNCPKGLVVHHKDGNYCNNSLDNLQILKQAAHVAIHNRERTGCIKENSKIRKVIKEVLKLKAKGYSRMEIVETLDVNYRTVKRCLLKEWRKQYE